jgi:hypothetical protein
LYPSGQTGSAHVDCFDFDAHRWQPIADALSFGIGSKSAYDCRTGHVWVQGTVSTYGLSELDPAADHWTMRRPNDDDFRYSYGQTADIDPAARRMISAGENKVVVWNIADPTKVTRSYPALHGDVEILARPAPGMAYDFHAQTMVAWAGGTDVYTIQADDANAVVTRRPAAAVNQVTAGALAATPTGTFGRFRYVPSRNVFIIVNSIETNVFLYRHTAGPGAAVDCQSGVMPPPVMPPPAPESSGDAGVDASDTAEAGAPMDAGAQPGSNTGSNGCGCVVHDRGGQASAVELSLFAVFLAAARARRRCSRAMAGKGRRSPRAATAISRT